MFLASVCLVLMSPVLGGIALLITLFDGLPVFFIQTRIGLHEREFRVYKFRTMRIQNQPSQSANLVTPFGRFLRRYSLDELPQLVNILRGEMSFVGPRPLLPEYVPLYTPAQRIRHYVRPGMTGLAQVSGRNALPWNERLKLDTRYAKNMGLKLDFLIIAKTISTVILGTGIQTSSSEIAEIFKGANEP